MLTATADEGTMLSDRDVDTEDDAVLEIRGDFLELHLELCHELGLTAKADLVTGLTLAGAAHNAEQTSSPCTNIHYANTHNRIKPA